MGVDGVKSIGKQAVDQTVSIGTKSIDAGRKSIVAGKTFYKRSSSELSASLSKTSIEKNITTINNLSQSLFIKIENYAILTSTKVFKGSIFQERIEKRRQAKVEIKAKNQALEDNFNKPIDNLKTKYNDCKKSCDDNVKKLTSNHNSSINSSQLSIEQKIFLTNQYNSRIEACNKIFENQVIEINNELEKLKTDWSTNTTEIDSLTKKYQNSSVTLSKTMGNLITTKDKITEFLSNQNSFSSHTDSSFIIMKKHIESELSPLKNLDIAPNKIKSSIDVIKQNLKHLEQQKVDALYVGNHQLATEIEEFINEIRKNPLISESSYSSKEVINSASKNISDSHRSQIKLLSQSDFKSSKKQDEYSIAQKNCKTELENAILHASRSHNYEKIDKSTNSAISSNSTQIDEEISKVNKELASLNTLVGTHPQFGAHAALLEKSFNEKFFHLGDPSLTQTGQDALLQDLQNISDAIKLIETEITHQQTIESLSKPHNLAKQELNNLKEAIAISTKNDSKLVIKTSDNREIWLEQKSREVGLPFKQGKSENAKKTVSFILTQLESSIKNPDLKSNAQETFDQLNNNKWIQDVLKEDDDLKNKFKAIGEELNPKKKVDTDKAVTNNSQDASLNIKEELEPSKATGSNLISSTQTFESRLYDPPGDSDFQESFLLSYTTVIDSMVTGNDKKKLSDSEKLFDYLITQYNAPETSFAQKQQILIIAEKWLNNPSFNNGQVTHTMDKIQELADTAANDGSPTLRSLSTTLSESLIKALKVEEVAKNFPSTLTDGDKNVDELIQNIALGKWEPDSIEYKLAVKEFAKSLTAQSEHDFKSINPAEYKNGKWETDPLQAPNIGKLTENANILSAFTKQSILNPLNESNETLTLKDSNKKHAQSARMIDFFVSVQEELISSENHSKDYSSFMGIEAGVASPDISRLHHTEKLTSKKTKKLREEYSTLCTLTGNYPNLKKVIATSDSPVVPCIIPLLVDVTGANTNPNKIHEQINKDKIIILGNLIGDSTKLQQSIKLKTLSIYRLKDLPIKVKNLSLIENGSSKSYDELTQNDISKASNNLSQIIEPREKK